MEALRGVDGWPAANVAVAVSSVDGELGARGDRQHVFRFASVTKLFTAYACLVAAEEGTIDLDDPAGPPGSTMRHLLAHASGLPFQAGMPVGRPGVRRVYSNPGIELAAGIVADHAAMSFDAYLGEAVLGPLGLRAELRGSPAADLYGSLDDLSRFAAELLAPRLVAPETLAEATSVQFPGLAGVIPDLGRYDPNDWGLGFELKDGKSRTGRAPERLHRRSVTSVARARSSGSIPRSNLSLACLTDLEFGEWAKSPGLRSPTPSLSRLALRPVVAEQGPDELVEGGLVAAGYDARGHGAHGCRTRHAHRQSHLAEVRAGMKDACRAHAAEPARGEDAGENDIEAIACLTFHDGRGSGREFFAGHPLRERL